MKVGLAAALPSELAALRRVAEAAGLEVVWAATSQTELAARASGVPLVVIAHGALDASLIAPELVTRGIAVVLAVADPAASVESLYRAIAAGGIEVAPIPSGSDADGALASILARHARRARPSVATLPAPVLAVAASAGGPDALAAVLCALPPDLPLRVIVAQHIEPTFAAGLASWLASRSGRRVELAEEGRALDVETTLVVRSDRQPTVDERGIVRYRALDPGNPFHPCIDALLASLAAAPRLRGAAALLTGMGSDGAAGMLALRQAGWVTIAQDAASSRVFGMPRAAAELGAATHVVALDRIGATLSRALRSGARA